MEHAIETFSLRKHFDRGKVKALQDVSLQVPRGSCFGLLGPNGAGKSTLVKSLLSIVRPTAGSATILGMDIRNPDARRSVGYLPEGHLFPRYLTGQGVCDYFGKLSGLSGPKLRQEIAEKLAMVGMTERARDRITKYSKGMKQRVGLAQAMIGNPDVIFLDEPTDGVDPVGRQEIRSVIREICDRGSTVFLNSHLLHEVELICDRVAILDKGKLIRQGTVKELLASLDDESGGVAVTFRTAAVPDALWAELTKQGARRESPEVFHMSLPGEDSISDVIDQLRAGSVAIYSIAQQQIQLEEAFIRLVKDNEEEGA